MEHGSTKDMWTRVLPFSHIRITKQSINAFETRERKRVEKKWQILRRPHKPARAAGVGDVSQAQRKGENDTLAA